MIDITIKLNRRQAKALTNGEEMVINILPPDKTHAEQIVAQARVQGLAVDVIKIIDEWNNHPYVREVGINEGRNNRISDVQSRSHERYFDRAVEKYGFVKIKNLMHQYFDACRKGLHQTQTGRNQGYGHCGGFVKKLVDVDGDTSLLWYTGKRAIGDNDNHPQLTLRIANAYAKKWLGRNKYGTITTLAVYDHFKHAGDWVLANARECKHSEEFILKVCFDDADRRAKEQGATMTPGWVCSDNCWRNYFPQALKKAVGVV